MSRKRLVILIFVISTAVLYYSGKGDRCRSYSALTCSELETTAQFNVYFYYPQDGSEFLGDVNGLSSCQQRANTFAAKKEVQSASWDYLCCLKTQKSACAEKRK